MFNGSTTSTIDRTCCLPITFSTSESHMMDLFITKLDEEYLVVLGYDWLTQHNPSIDWVETKITFQDLRKGRTPEKLPSPTPEAIDIHLVSERTMKKLSQETGSTMFLLSPIDTLWPAPHWLEARAMATDLPEDPLSIIPMEYLEFHDVFSGDKANTLAPHRPYNLKINLEEGAKLFHGPVYSLSPPELSTLREFLEENIKNGFIHPSKSPWGSPVLFVKKKDGSLHLCMDFHTLNRVMEKDHYPLPLIPDLLNSPAPARIYSKIDLKHTYHLVHITEGDKPKTAFCTCYGSFKW